MSHLIFTLDFHEMVRGKLRQNEVCTLHYDPLRLASGIPGYVHGSPDFEFRAGIEFKPSGAISIDLTSKTGILENPVVLENGRGSMLSGDFTIPADASEIIVWVSMREKNGNISYDSDYGKNYHFRLFDIDVEITKSKVENKKKLGTSVFTVEAACVPDVEAIWLRYRVTNGPEPLEEVPVSFSRGQSKKSRVPWTTGPITLPYDSVVIYDLVYAVAGNRFKIENNGNYFIAHVGG